MSKNKSSDIYVKIESKSLGKEVDFIKAFLDPNETAQTFEKLKASILKILDLGSEVLDLTEDHLEPIPDTSDLWTTEKFKELISDQNHKETYDSKGQIERLSELGADLMNLADKEQWQLSYRFRQLYFAFYFRGSPIFGVNLQSYDPRLCVWLPEDIVIDREADGETDQRHERYYEWYYSIGFAAYPTNVEVASLEGLLRFTYLYRTGQLD